jgi:hypothetical protein
MNAGQVKQTIGIVLGWAAFGLAIVAATKLFGVQFPIQIRGSASELALVACALALARIP